MVKQRELKYDRLIEKAKELFIKNGYRHITMDEIASTAGISKVTLYKHFPSKESLFIYIVNNLTKEYYDLLEDKLATIEGSLEKLNFIFDYSFREYKNYSLAFYKDMMEPPHIWQQLLKYRKERAIKICEEILLEGIKNNQLRDINIKHTITLLLSLGEALPKILPLYDDVEAEAFMVNYYDFIKFALTRK